ncbi:hypothetical protein HAX54_004302, partial [Datura stramonium]|nr:hypothetical protein [Datura stramonium]
AGMMSSGYAWIITDVLTSLLDLVDHSVIESSMQGVLDIKPYVPRSNELNNFTKRWRKIFRQQYPDTDPVKLNVFGLWAYDSITALAKAVVEKPDSRENLTDLDALGTSELGSLLLDSIQNTELKTALSGEFRLINGELHPSPYQIMNIDGTGQKSVGFWTEKDGISYKLKIEGKTAKSNKQLGAIIWPGESTIFPRGWELPTSGKKLRVGVPVKGGLQEFIKVERDSKTQGVTATGFCADVFKEVIRSLPYAVPYEFVPVPITHTPTSPGYDDLVYKLFFQKHDAVIGDMTISANRSNYVDFTLPFTESDISAVVPVKDDDRKNAWIFVKPLKSELWITTAAFFVSIGFVVWVLEHRVNKEFQGPRREQVGMIFWFSFSTLVFAHRERVTSNLTRFVTIVWVFVVLVLTSSYTASLTSMLTAQKLQPSITDLNDLIKNGEYVGYQKGSFVIGVLKGMRFDSSKFRSYSTLEEYNDALSRGSKNGGVGAIVDELPYLRLFLNKYCRKYIMVGPTYKTAGFGFAFPKGSPLVPDFSRAVLKVIEGEFMNKIIQKWFWNETDCPQKDGMDITSDSLTLESFKGLFLIAGVSAGSALLIFFLSFLYQKREVLASDDSIGKKLFAIAKVFDEEKDNSNSKSENPSEGNEGQTAILFTTSEASPEILPDLPLKSPEIRISDGLGASPTAEGFSTTEPGTPVHETITGAIEERLNRALQEIVQR